MPRRMPEKILIDKKDIGDYYEPSDSDNEYTEREKSLLKKIRKGRHTDDNLQREILTFDTNDDDDENEDEEDDEFDEKYGSNSDIEDADNDEDIPDAKAWGNKRRDFHSTDFIDADYSTYNARDEELAEQEETEAREIQKRLAKQYASFDFLLDVVNRTESSSEKQKKSAEETDGIHMQKDLSQLSKRQKEQLFKKDSPEFAGLIQDFRQYLTDSIELLDPVLKFLKSNNVEQHPLVNLATQRNQLILNYCTNISFYLVLKSKRVKVKNHPIVQRLVKLKSLLTDDKKYVNFVKPEFEKILSAIKDGKKISINMEEASEEQQKKKLRVIKNVETSHGYDDLNEGDMNFEQKLNSMATNSEDENIEEDDDVEDNDVERRQITYQMSKNKGLTPYRKKELRNPRVKHRNKFRKAIIRRKGAVRTVQKEIKRYDGEKFGIKASVKKGIKIK